ncbi:MAG: VCBS repeat-containing protein, partial [Verrucomicrobiota bacterium]
MKRTSLLLFLLVGLAETQAQPRVFKTIQLNDEFHAESATLADLDNDGDMDVIYGPYWFEGPDFKQRNTIYSSQPFPITTYSDNFFVYVEDLDKDGWKDVLVLGFPGRKNSTYWFKNPGSNLRQSIWQKHVVFDGVENESPVWADVTGDGQNEVLCSVRGQFGLVAPAEGASPESRWQFTPISPPGSTGGKFTHGLGFGDVNGDGRQDLLEKTGWWEQPPPEAKEPFWKKHPHPFGQRGGSQMHAYDFDGDGDNDIVTSLDAHGYGFAWFEQISSPESSSSFKRHMIMGSSPEASPFGVCFSQLHGIRLDDFDGDGVLDIVTGKRYFAHGGKDPGGKDPPVVVWFRTARQPDRSVIFEPYPVHDQSGVGTDVVTGDLNADGRIDIITGNKKGCFIHLQTGNAAPAPKRETTPKTTVLEGERLEIVKAPGNLRMQNLAGFRGVTWSGDAQLWWTGAQPGDLAEVTFPVRTPGAYQLSAVMTKAKDYGIMELAVDGKKVLGPMDFYSPRVQRTKAINLGEPLELTAGTHRLTIKSLGKHSDAVPGFMFGLDVLRLQPVDGEALTAPKPSKPKTVPKPNPTRRKLKAGNSLDAEPSTPAEQQASFSLPEGFIVELVAS